MSTDPTNQTIAMDALETTSSPADVEIARLRHGLASIRDHGAEPGTPAHVMATNLLGAAPLTTGTEITEPTMQELDQMVLETNGDDLPAEIRKEIARTREATRCHWQVENERLQRLAKEQGEKLAKQGDELEYWRIRHRLTIYPLKEDDVRAIVEAVRDHTINARIATHAIMDYQREGHFGIRGLSFKEIVSIR